MLKRGRRRQRRNRKRGTPFKDRLIVAGRKALRVLSPVVVLVLILGGVWTVYGELLRTPYLEIKKIKVDGLRLVSKEALVEKILAEGEKNILAFDLKKATVLVEEEPFVKSASIRRILPDTLEVVVEERVPVAIVRLDGLYLVDESGEPFKRYSVKDGISLPIITGLEELDESGLRDAISGVLGFLHMVALSGELTPDSLSEVHVDRVKGYTLVTRDEGVRILVGREDFEKKFVRLARFLEARGGDMTGIKYINLNDYRGVVVGFDTPEASKEGGMG